MESTAAPVPIDQLLAHRAWLQRLARALVGDPQTADDLVQEVWLSAMQRPPRHRRSLRGWLATVLRRKAIDRSRAAGRRARYEAAPPSPRRDTSAEELIAETEMHKRVTDAVLALKEPYRSTLVLRYVGGHPIAEVAGLMDVPVETVRTRLKRGLAALRKRLDGEHGGDRRAWMAILVPIAWPDRALATSTAVAATVTGGVIVGSKLAAVAGAVVVVALATWASFELAGDDFEEGAPSDASALTRSGMGESANEAQPVLEGRGDEPATGSRPNGSTPDARAGTTRAGREGPKAAPGRIAGRVLGPDGKPVEGVTVVVERLDAQGKLHRGEGFPKHWGADPGGWFKMDDLPGGGYVLRVYAPGFAERILEATAGHAPLAITLEKGLSLSGRLVAEDPRIELVAIPLRARPEASPVMGRAIHAETDAEGRFAFEGLATGGFLITFGFRNLAKENPAAPLVPIRFGPVQAGRDDVEIQVALGDTLAGTLVHEDGSPVTKPVRVEAMGLTDDNQENYDRRHFGASTLEGTFELLGVARGRYSLSFEPIWPKHERVLRGPRTIYVKNVASGTTDLRVTLLDGLAVHGRLVDKEDKPVSGHGFVQVRPAGSVRGGQDALVLRVDDEGRFHTPPVDPDMVYVISISSFSGYMRKTVEQVIPSEEGVVIQLVPAGRLTGRVVDEKGAPAAGAGVSAHAIKQPPDAEGRNGFDFVDPDGHFAIEGLGEFEFRVHAGGASSGYIPAGEVAVVKPGQKDVVLRVKRGVPLSGRIVDQQGRPVQSPYVAVTNGALVWFTQVCDEEGRFRFPGVPRGKLSLSARIDGEHVILGDVEASGEDLVVKVPAR